MPELRRPRRGLQLLFGVPLLIVVFAAIAFTALIAYTLIARGIGEGNPGWVVLGAAAAAAWLLMLRVSLLRREKRQR